MSLFPRNFYGADATFTPLFRLLDEFDNYRTDVQGTNGAGGRKGTRGLSVRTFNPKFDVRETENTYELHGELPGIDRENITIEFTEPQTIVVSGHVERSYQSGTPPSGYLEGTKMSGAITEGGEQKSHKATVEEESGEKAKEQGAVSKKEEQQQQPKEKYWVSERSVGEFSRTFSFPTRVDQDNVTASLENGVLNISVPKAKKHESRRISVK
ncbi:Heat shock protein 30 [Coniochaeta hoffmannii]|uniref:Heat shock protein 30 n=1 Tax=Coniochaeta hoffmannii TaxID=91930 RepID=A0AA38RYQ4_9PEZI|nr:Heat shock protein 30 [Coniochaeta hoffmannii]